MLLGVAEDSGGKEQGVAGQEWGDDKAGLGKENQEEQSVCPKAAVVLDKPCDFFIGMEKGVDPKIGLAAVVQ